MSPQILLTSFNTWRSGQKSNSSDDLVRKFGWKISQDNIHLLRRIPVSFRSAPEQVIDRIEQIQPDIIVNCGMAESRQFLTIESRARRGRAVIKTKVDLNSLVTNLPLTRISHDAGRFVCNSLYYSVLDYVDRHALEIPSIFVHVPILTKQNSVQIVSDFRSIITRIQALALAKDHV